MDEKLLKRDPLEDFLSSLLAEAVDLGVRDVVRESVMDMAAQYMVDETATGIYNEVFDEELRKVVPGMVCGAYLCVCFCVFVCVFLCLCVFVM